MVFFTSLGKGLLLSKSVVVGVVASAKGRVVIVSVKGQVVVASVKGRLAVIGSRRVVGVPGGDVS